MSAPTVDMEMVTATVVEIMVVTVVGVVASVGRYAHQLR